MTELENCHSRRIIFVITSLRSAFIFPNSINHLIARYAKESKVYGCELQNFARKKKKKKKKKKSYRVNFHTRFKTISRTEGKVAMANCESGQRARDHLFVMN